MNYRPSQIAACACIISVNIYEEDLYKDKKTTTFFPDPKKGKLLELNTDIWNNETVVNITNYPID